jgi:hypothetical protein
MFRESTTFSNSWSNVRFKKNLLRFLGGKNEIQKICLFSVNFASNWIKHTIYKTYEVCKNSRKLKREFSVGFTREKTDSFYIISMHMIKSRAWTRVAMAHAFIRYNFCVGEVCCMTHAAWVMCSRRGSFRLIPLRRSTNHNINSVFFWELISVKRILENV